MEMVLELGSALRLPEFVNSFTTRVAGMMQAQVAILALAQGRKLEGVGFSGIQLERVIYAGQRHEQRLPDGSRAGSINPDMAHRAKDTMSATLIRRVLASRL